MISTVSKCAATHCIAIRRECSPAIRYWRGPINRGRHASGETAKKRRDRIVQQPGLPPKSSLDKAGKAERKHFENARSADEKRLTIPSPE